MSEQITQFYKVIISSPPKATSKVSVDVTSAIQTSVTIHNEDGLVKECTFNITDGYLWMDILSVGMIVDVTGGTLEYNNLRFSGYIKQLKPKMDIAGDVLLEVCCYSQEAGLLGVTLRDLHYPSKNSPFSWANTNAITYSQIIINLAKEAGSKIKVLSQNIQVKKDKTAAHTGGVKQNKLTDWAFMQFLAEKINCTVWTEEKGGISYLHLVDNSLLVNNLADVTFFYLARSSRSDFIPFTQTSEKQIRLLEVEIDLDSKTGKAVYKQSTNPDGTTKTVAEVTKDNGSVERWVLNEDKVNHLPEEERTNLINLFMAGKITWEGDKGQGIVSAQEYFTKITLESSSREAVSNNVQVVNSAGNLNPDGLSTQNSTTQNTGSTSKATVIDSDKLAKVSPEDRAAIMARIARGEMTEQDKSYYTVVDTTPSASAEESKKPGAENTKAGVDKKKGKVQGDRDNGKRDSGFKITAKVYGDLRIVPKISYVIEGIGKYSTSYYMYRVNEEWGNDGFMMHLTFTK